MTIPRDQIRRILCIKPRGIGDIILSTIILENLAAAFPGAAIDYLTEGFAADAVRELPLVRKVLTYDKSEFLFAVVRRVRKEQYDLLIDLWSNPRSAQISFFSGVRFRVGYGYRGRRYAYNLPGTRDRGNHHAAEHNLELLKPLGVPVISRRLHFATSPTGDASARKWLTDRFGQRPLVGIIPSGGWESKRCPPVTWIQICHKLSERYDPAFVILWGPGDEPDVAEIRKGFPGNIDTAPPTSLRDLASFIKHVSLVIVNDSGPMHIAAALGVPTIGLFGPTDPRNHGPYGPHGGAVIKSDLHCISCNKLRCPYKQECMHQLPLDDLLARAEELAGDRLRGNGPGTNS